MKITFNKRLFLVLISLTALLLLANCNLPGAAPAEPTLDATAIFQSALLTATYGVPTPTPTPPTVPRTPPALPGTFHTDFLNPKDAPHTYVADTCQYLLNRWNPNNAAPGTVIMPIMFHGISKDDVLSDPNQITKGQLGELLKNLKDQGFEAITMQQAADFMERNAKIPNRSVLLIVDDRHYREYFDVNFVPTLQEYHWTLINAWISLPDSITTAALPGNIELQNAGLVDHQSHGVVHNFNISEWPDNYTITTDYYGTISAEDFIKGEMIGSMDLIEKNYGKRPIAYIWPGGGFSKKAVEIGTQGGYKLGFTINPRGPVMYNWIPLADETDPARPSYIPEGGVGNYLMVLPRYWDSDASNNIDNVRLMGKSAAAEAEQNKAVELEYYDIVCKPVLGDIPALQQ
ncbi:MAG: polysaccharide deacetylase family protein [Anaerolineae bacterium]|nr:polysaccharide deacetylase family protein [Anaerolineae bacterium]